MPYERRAMELLKVDKDKRAFKYVKARVSLNENSYRTKRDDFRNVSFSWEVTNVLRRNVMNLLVSSLPNEKHTNKQTRTNRILLLCFETK